MLRNILLKDPPPDYLWTRSDFPITQKCVFANLCSTLSEKSRRMIINKMEYLENKMIFSDRIKSTLLICLRTFFWWNKTKAEQPLITVNNSKKKVMKFKFKVNLSCNQCTSFHKEITLPQNYCLPQQF